MGDREKETVILEQQTYRGNFRKSNTVSKCNVCTFDRKVMTGRGIALLPLHLWKVTCCEVVGIWKVKFATCRYQKAVCKETVWHNSLEPIFSRPPQNAIYKQFTHCNMVIWMQQRTWEMCILLEKSDIARSH